MPYLKNTLGGIGRSLHDSALSSFQGPHRWWKLALYVVMFVLPGGSLGILAFSWIDHRRNGRAAMRAQVAPGAVATGAVAAKGAKAAAGAPAAAARLLTACQSRSDKLANTLACRAAASKPARQTMADPRCQVAQAGRRTAHERSPTQQP